MRRIFPCLERRAGPLNPPDQPAGKYSRSQPQSHYESLSIHFYDTTTHTQQRTPEVLCEVTPHPPVPHAIVMMIWHHRYQRYRFHLGLKLLKESV